MGRETEKWESLDPQLLRETFDRIDPLPRGLVEDLSRAFELRRGGTVLARLTGDDADDGSSVPDPGGSARTAVFESDRCSVTASWSSGPDGSDLLDLDGSVERAVPAALLIETPKSTTNGDVDGQRIHAEGLRHGPVRLCLIMADTDEPWLLETEWITV
jgi:hypothetical protein